MRSSRFFAAVLTLVALTAMAAELGLWRTDQRQKETLLGFLESSGLDNRQPALRQRIDSEPDPQHAKLLVARALLHDTLDAREMSQVEPSELDGWFQDRVARFGLAARLATEVLAERPASWQGQLIRGAGTYLAWSLDRNPALIRQYRDWEAPLERALELAPSEPEPVRFLAMAYLEMWSSLSPGKRARARELVRRGLEDPRAFRHLLNAWLEVTPNLDDALGLLPETSQAWKEAERALARLGRFDRVCEARQRSQIALATELEARLEEAVLRLEGGDGRAARQALLAILDDAPAEARYAPLVARAMTLLPAGPIDHRHARSAQRWLVWEADRSLLGETSLSKAVLSRLAALLPESEAALLAHVLLLGPEPDRAETVARHAPRIADTAWAPYFLERARLAKDKGLPREASQALDRLPSSWQRSPLTVALRHDLGELDRPQPRKRWPRTLWRWPEDSRSVIELFVDEASQIEIEIVDPGKAAVELSWDGAVKACEALGPTTRRLELALDDESDEGPLAVHRLEISRIAGARVLPGDIQAR